MSVRDDLSKLQKFKPLAVLRIKGRKGNEKNLVDLKKTKKKNYGI